MLKSSYVTLAAMEYRQASQAAPQEAGVKYSEAYQRVKGDATHPLAIDPENLQETGWATDILGFLGLAAAGGAGYLIYKNQHRGGGSIQQPPVQPTPAPVISTPAGDWTARAPMGTGKGSPVGGVIDGRIYVVGGTPSAGFNVLERYDPATDVLDPRGIHADLARGGRGSRDRRQALRSRRLRQKRLSDRRKRTSWNVRPGDQRLDIQDIGCLRLGIPWRSA